MICSTLPGDLVLKRDHSPVPKKGTVLCLLPKNLF